MEGVNQLPVPQQAAKGLGDLLPRLIANTQDDKAVVSDAAEVRAQTALAQARRQAQAEVRQARDRADALREQGEKSRAKARVAAATSGLTLSGTSLLSLENIGELTENRLGELFGATDTRVGDILTAGEEQARSIRLSGRTVRKADAGLGSLLQLGRGLSDDWPPRSTPRTPPYFPQD